jgi:hypothetical protein
MKFIPSLTRLPKYQKFHIKPRYYDPVKEDIQERTSRIKRDMAYEGGEEDVDIAGNIVGSFRHRMATGRVHRSDHTTVLRLSIIIILVGFMVGYVYFGNDVVYGLFLFAPLYIWFRLKGSIKKK